MLNSSKKMNLSFGDKVCLIRQLGGIEYTKALGYSVFSNACLPSSISFVNTKKSALIVAFAFVKILGIFRWGRLSQVGYSVVSPNPIDVINLLLRPLAIYMNPNEAMCKVKSAKYGDTNVVIIGAITGLITYLHSMCRPSSPAKIAGLLVVVKYFTQILCAKIGVSHDVVPHKQLIGQKPARVDSTGGLRHFTRARGAI